MVGTFLNKEYSKGIYDYFILVRISPDPKSLMKHHRLFFSTNCNLDKLNNIILNQTWKYDIPGFISRQQLLYIIKNKFILPQGSFLNNKTKMDAENYYVQTGDMKDIEKIDNLIN